MCHVIIGDSARTTTAKATQELSMTSSEPTASQQVVTSTATPPTQPVISTGGKSSIHRLAWQVRNCADLSAARYSEGSLFRTHIFCIPGDR